MRSLRARLTLWFALAVTATAGVVSWVGHVRLIAHMEDGIDFLLDAEAQEVEARLASAAEPLTASRSDPDLVEHVAIDAPQYYFQIHRLGHGIVFRSENLEDHVLPDIAADSGAAGMVQIADRTLRHYQKSFGDYRVVVATDWAQFGRLVDEARKMFALGVPLVFVASLVVGLLVSALALRPIRAMQEAATRINASNLAERLPVPVGDDEIARLARLLNELFDRIETSFEQIRRFTADAAHELKTPLALIRLHGEKLLKECVANGGAKRGELESQLEEVERLERIVRDLLLLARADAGALRLVRKEANAADFLASFVEDATALAEDGRRLFEAEGDAEAIVRVDFGLVRQVLLNLLSNAIRHTPEGKRIRLSTGLEGRDWLLELQDEGPGIPEPELERVFERFVRGEGARADTDVGSGLGLAIARSIVAAHGGTISAVNRAGGGLSVRIRLVSVVVR
jgi:heavy metal sensor kinase